MIVRTDVKELSRSVDGYCIHIRRQTDIYTASDLRGEALEMIEQARKNKTLSNSMAGFFRRKIYASLIEGGFRNSADYHSFGRKHSKRYDPIFR